MPLPNSCAGGRDAIKVSVSVVLIDAARRIYGGRRMAQIARSVGPQPDPIRDAKRVDAMIVARDVGDSAVGAECSAAVHLIESRRVPKDDAGVRIETVNGSAIGP